MEAPGVCCERCPGATPANTRHLARRRLLKAAVFHPQAAAPPETAFPAHRDDPGQPQTAAVTGAAFRPDQDFADPAGAAAFEEDDQGDAARPRAFGAGSSPPVDSRQRTAGDDPVEGRLAGRTGLASTGPDPARGPLAGADGAASTASEQPGGPAGGQGAATGSALTGSDRQTSGARLTIPRQPGPVVPGPRRPGPRDDSTANRGLGHRHGPRYAPAAAYTRSGLYRAVTGEIIDVSPQVVVIGDGGGERRFALTADTRAWRGGPLDPAALTRGDVATIRLLPDRPGVADRIWANIGRVTGTIVSSDDDCLLVAESRTKAPQTVIIPARARVKVQVRYPNLQRGYLLDLIGLRRADYLEGVLPANSQPTYHSDLVQRDRQPPGRLADSITGSATWHDSADEPYGVLGVSYPAIDPAASCREDSIAGYLPGQAPAFRDLPYLAVGSALTVRNECTGISCTLPVTGCAPMARLFNDRCVACENSPRGRVADLTVASFVALGGELEEGCFSTTLTIGR